MISAAIDPYWTLTLALLLDAAIGRPGWLASPLRMASAPIVGAIGWADARLNRVTRPAGDRRIRGAVALIALAGGAGFVGHVLDDWLSGGLGMLAKVLIVMAFCSQRAAFDAARAALGDDSGDAFAHRRRISGLAAALTRVVVAPALVYAVAGLGGLFAYGVLSAFACQVGHDDPFGAAAHAVARAIHFITAMPATALIVVAAIFSPGAAPGKAFAGAWNGGAMAALDGGPGWSLAALAGAFGLSFEGRGGWIGGGRARVDAQDARRALYLFAVACLIHLTVWTALGFLSAA